MDIVRRSYNRTDEWLKSLSQGQYGVVLGLSAGVGMLVMGLLIADELYLVRAITIALVMFGLEYVFGLHQTTEEA